jgi:uncharacterized protein (DUF983 family)
MIRQAGFYTQGSASDRRVNVEVTIYATSAFGRPDASLIAQGTAALLYEFMTTARMSTVLAILLQRCPRCRIGRIFRKSIFAGFPKMWERCPNCGLKFEREQGYFLGAMYISYGVALVTIVALALLLWGWTPWSLQKITVWAILLFLPLAPTIALFSRVLWIYLDRAIDPGEDWAI